MPSSAGAAPAPRSRPRRRRGSSLLVGFLVVVLLVTLANRITLDDYVLSPGQAESVGPLISVPHGRAHRVHGAVLLTDVSLSQETLLSWLPDHLSSDDQIVPSVELTGSSSIPTSELNAQGFLEMVQAKAAAKTVALRRLGYSVPEHNAGVVIEAVTSGTPAYGRLQVGQVITGIDGVDTPDVCAFVGRLATLQVGQDARLAVQANSFSASGSLIAGPTKTEAIRLASRPGGLPAQTGCSGTAPAKGFLGISVQTQQDYAYPFPIGIDTANIGGPSAGLAMTLGLINVLGGGRLTGGRRVAATGTMDAQGDVGDVGGVAQKTVAVEAAGATVFFVPTPELAAARSKATASLHVYAVHSLDQVLSILKKLGGHVPSAG